MPDNFYMDYILNFELLGVGYFCIAINIPEFCFWMQLSFLEFDV